MRESTIQFGQCAARVAMGIAAMLTLSGCIFKEVREQQAKADAFCMLSGTVATERATERPLIVGLARHAGGDINTPQNWALVDHFVLEEAGRWMFRASPSTYVLVAFEDGNADGVYQPGEPFLRAEPEKVLTCQSGERKTDLALVIPAQGRSRVDGPVNFVNFKARTAGDQQQLTIGELSVVGKLASLDDPKFSQEVASNSLWRPYDFVIDVGPGIYFLQPYDPKKIPVLFVHGLSGTPINFRTLISRLDTSKYQPWVYYYPSGAFLDAVDAHLDQAMKTLQLEYGFTRYHMVAHSMGGLVSRGFALKNQTASSRAKIGLYVTISTPWNGHKGAASGVKHAPTVVRVWNDMAPDSTYIKGLFFTEKNGKQERRSLPGSMQHHLLFGFKQDSSEQECTDNNVTVSSQLYAPAQADAVRVHGFDETHMSILESTEVSQLINRLLDEAS